MSFERSHRLITVQQLFCIVTAGEACRRFNCCLLRQSLDTPQSFYLRCNKQRGLPESCWSHMEA